MKKKKIAMILITMLFLLTGCRRTIKPEDAATLFVDRFVYEKKDDKFVKSFKDGAEIDKQLNKVTKKFQNNLIISLNSLGGGNSLQEGKQIVNNLMTKVKQDTSYKVKEVKKVKGEKKTVVVTFEVNGLNFNKVYKKTMNTLIEKMLKDPKIAEDEDKMMDITFTAFNKEIKNAEVKKKPVRIYVKFKQEKKRWIVAENQGDQLSNLYVAFIAGVRNEQAFGNEMNATLKQVLKEAEEKIDKEIAAEEKAKKKAAEKKAQNNVP